MTANDVLDQPAIEAIRKAYRAGEVPALTGFIVCFTGTLSVSRNDLYSLVNALDGLPTNRVTSITDVLVAANPRGASTKCRDARRYGVVILDEETFINRLMTGTLRG